MAAAAFYLRLSFGCQKQGKGRDGGSRAARRGINVQPTKNTPRVTHFARKLTAWFEQQNITKEAFAAKVGTSRQLLRKWLNGEFFPTNRFCERLYPITQLSCFSPEQRDEARHQHDASIPAEIQKVRKQKYEANADVFRKRSMDSYHKRYEAQRQFVDSAELEALKKDPRRRKNVCRLCGQWNLKDIGPHLAQMHPHVPIEVYKERFGFLRSRNATRSEETQAKQSAVMKK